MSADWTFQYMVDNRLLLGKAKVCHVANSPDYPKQCLVFLLCVQSVKNLSRFDQWYSHGPVNHFSQNKPKQEMTQNTLFLTSIFQAVIIPTFLSFCNILDLIS